MYFSPFIPEYIKRLVAFAIFTISIWTLPISVNAQVQVNINLQPAWGPTEYDYVEYYYLPEYEVYYDVPRHRFVYYDGGRWLFARSLPSRYGSVNYYSTYKVVINEPRAYKGFHDHKVQYASYKHGRHPQNNIRDSHSPKYNKHSNDPQHNQNRSKQSSVQSSQKPKGGGHGNGGKKH